MVIKMDARKKVVLILRITFYVIGVLTILLVLNLMTPKDIAFSSTDQISEYLLKRYNQSIINTVKIKNFSFVAVESKDKAYYTSRIIYSKNGKYRLFEASTNETIFFKVIFGVGSIEVYHIDKYYIVSVSTGEVGANGNPIAVSDNKNGSFSMLKITDDSLNFYEVLEDLPSSFIIYIDGKIYRVN